MHYTTPTTPNPGQGTYEKTKVGSARSGHHHIGDDQLIKPALCASHVG